MKFKEHFLLTENPDDLYNHDPSSITFGFCSNFIFWFDPAQDTSFIPTHVELLLITKAKHLNKPIEALVQSPEYRRKLNSFKKLYHEKGYMPLDCVNFLKGTDMLYGTTRDDFINDVPHAFLGRLSIKGNIISFWNPPDNFNDHTKQTVRDFLGLVNMNPEALTYNFELQGSREINLTYHQFFNIKKEEPKTKVNTSHIVHTTDPAKKQEVLKGMGVKPKTPIDIKSKYKMGESFQDHFNSVFNEDAEYVKYTNEAGFRRKAGYTDKDARAFIVDHDFNIIADNENQYHGGLLNVLYDNLTQADPIPYSTNGTLSEEFKKVLNGEMFNRSLILRTLPNVIQGRLWLEQKVIGFWNNIGPLKNNIKYITKFFHDNKLNPNDYQWEIPDSEYIYSFEDFKQELGIRVPDKEEPKSELSDWQNKPLHLVAPEKKKEALKAMGVMPKPAKGVDARYAMGESFKDHFNTFNKSPDRTISSNKTDQILVYREYDARAFIIEDDFICIANNWNTKHGQIYSDIEKIFKYKREDYNKSYTIIGQPSVKFLSHVGTDVYRSDIVEKFPNWIQGRLWKEHNYISFWNHGENVINNLPTIEKVITLVGGNPSEYKFEIDNDKVLNLQELKNNNVSPESDKDTNWQQAVHILPPEKKGEMMKAQGIKPKAPLGAEQRYKMGESFKQHFLNYIKESFDWDNLKYQYSSPENYNLHRLDFFNKQGAVGYIEWDKDDGETEKIYVGEPYRRKGIASHIWEVATEWANANKQLPPEHSSRRSESGEAFAQSVGGYIPRLNDDIDGWSSK